MSAHYPSGSLTVSVINNGTIQWYYNGSTFTPGQYSGGYYYYCLYRINGGGWNAASTSNYPVTSLGLNGLIEYALTLTDNPGNDGAISSDYKITGWTRTSTYYYAPQPSTYITDYPSSGYLSLTYAYGLLSGYTNGYWTVNCQWSLDGSNWNAGTQINYSSLGNSATIYYRSYQSGSGYSTTYSSTLSYYWTRPTCPTPSSATFSLNLTYDRVDITYPTYSPYTVVNQYSVDGCSTWSSASGNYPLSSLWAASGKTIYVRSKCTYPNYLDSGWNQVSYSSPTCPIPSIPTLSADSTNVNISYPSNSNYTTYSEYSVDQAATWSQATSSTYPLDSLDVASGRKIYIRSKFTRAYHYDSGWSAYGNYQEPTCPSTGSISISERADGSNIDITISSIPSGYTLWVEYQEQGYPSWYPVQQSTTSYATSNYTTSLSCSGIPNGTGITVRAYLTKSHYFDGSPVSSNQITYTQGTCPIPTISATYNKDTDIVSITATAPAGYLIRLYYTLNGGSNTFIDSGNSPTFNYSWSSSAISNGTVVVICANCSKAYYIDSAMASSNSFTISRRPSNSTCFNFTSNQTMTAQNVVKVSNGNYTADAIIMSATTWNAFKAKVNDFRQYKGYATFNPAYTVAVNTIFTASIYNDMADAITQILPYGMSVAHIAANGDITASVLMELQNKLNSIT